MRKKYYNPKHIKLLNLTLRLQKYKRQRNMLDNSTMISQQNPVSGKFYRTNNTSFFNKELQGKTKGIKR